MIPDFIRWPIPCSVIPYCRMKCAERYDSLLFAKFIGLRRTVLRITTDFEKLEKMWLRYITMRYWVRLRHSEFGCNFEGGLFNTLVRGSGMGHSISCPWVHISSPLTHGLSPTIFRQNAFCPYVMTGVGRRRCRRYRRCRRRSYKVRQSYISRTVWPRIIKFCMNLHTRRVYNHTGYDVTM